MPRQRTAVSERICAHCGATFTAWNYVISIGSAVFCSQACHNEGQRVRQIEKTCEGCGNTFKVYIQRAARSRFCNRACRSEFQRSQRTSLTQRLWAKVQSGDTEQCWAFTGSRLKSGYGHLGSGGRNGRVLRAHRVAWEAMNGPIPPGLHVCHRCDNPPCCNPAHLFLGTHADNMRDKKSKGHAR